MYCIMELERTHKVAMYLRIRTRFVRLMLIVICALLGGIFFLLSDDEELTPIEENSYFVSSKGNDKNNGTFERPWKTRQKASDTLKPGETAFIQNFIYTHLKNEGIQRSDK